MKRFSEIDTQELKKWVRGFEILKNRFEKY